MNKHIILLAIVLVAAIVPGMQIQAQYTIPAYDVELINDNTTFEESEGLIQSQSLEERQIIIEVEDDKPNQTSWAQVRVYSLDGEDVLGPYTVTEGTQLRVPIDQREWGVIVIDFISGAIISTWIEQGSI